MRIIRKIFFSIAAVTLFLSSSACGACAAESSPIKLDADTISYDESTGIAIAEGNVRMTDNEFHTTTPYLEFDNNTQLLRAFSSSAERVVVFTSGKRLTGDRLDYNLETRRGIMTQANGKIDNFYVNGRMIDIMPSSETPARKNRKKVSSGDVNQDEDELAAIWRGATLTTCNEPHPHYRLEAKTVTIYPGEKMVLHVPKAYLGSVMIMVSPFDITISLKDKDKRNHFFPHFGYDENKGVGLGVAGSYNWRGGDLVMEFAGWSEGIFETDILATQRLAADLSLYAGIRRAYDKDLDDVDWRYRWGLNYNLNDWGMSLGWTKNELLSVEKRAGDVSEYVLDRKPEFSISSPWFRDPAMNGSYRIFGMWGNYKEARWDNSLSHDRTGLGIQIVGEPGKKRNFTPFYSATYTHYFYDDDTYDTQRVLDTRFGILWKSGGFESSTSYQRQWVWGHSPMSWDYYGDREEMYQEIAYTIPTKSLQYSWRLAARAAYDIMTDEMAEMVYKVSYNQHCLLWEAVYRDDLRGEDDWMGVTLSIQGLPNAGFRLFGSDENQLSDPFAH
jgi:LPS-assembly protein